MAIAFSYGARLLPSSTLLKSIATAPAPLRVAVTSIPIAAQPVPVRVIERQLVPDAGVPRFLPMIAPRADAQPVVQALPAPVTVSTPQPAPNDEPSSCGGCGMTDSPSAIPPSEPAATGAPVVTAPKAPALPAGTPATLPNKTAGRNLGMALFAMLLIVAGGLALASAVRPR